MKTPSKKTLKKKCDVLWSEIVKIRAGYKCELCGKKENLQSHHVFGRRANSTRFDTNNGVCLCWRCHFVEAEQNAARFGLWIVSKRGQEWYDTLNTKYGQLVKIDYEGLLIELQAEKHSHYMGHQCPHCGEVVRSKHRHDFVACGCGKTAVDGGDDYIKVSFKGKPPVPVYGLAKNEKTK